MKWAEHPFPKGFIAIWRIKKFKIIKGDAHPPSLTSLTDLVE
jgi:hypothetical protein